MSCTPAKINFTELEKNILCELISKYQCIVETKSNDARSVQKKKEVWVDLTKDFNSKSGVNKRSSKQLRKCWENMKSRAKKTSKPGASQMKKGTLSCNAKLSPPTLVPLPEPIISDSEVEQFKLSQSSINTSCKKEKVDVSSLSPQYVKSEESIMVNPDQTFLPEQPRNDFDQAALFSSNVLMGNCWPEGATAFIPIPMNRLCRTVASLPGECSSATQLEILKMHQSEHEVQMRILHRQMEMQEQEHQARMELVIQHKRVLDLQEQVFSLQLQYMQQFDLQSHHQSDSGTVSSSKVKETT